MERNTSKLLWLLVVSGATMSMAWGQVPQLYPMPSAISGYPALPQAAPPVPGAPQGMPMLGIGSAQPADFWSAHAGLNAGILPVSGPAPGLLAPPQAYTPPPADNYPLAPEAMSLQNYYSQVRALRGQNIPTALLPPTRQPDPNGLARFYNTDTPRVGYEFYGAPKVALNTRPDSLIDGIRLDTSWDLLRELEVGVYLSEYQSNYVGGVTLLPYQNPGLIVGLRLLGGYADNHSLAGSPGTWTIEGFVGTRYKLVYLKTGGFWDAQTDYQKIGGTVSVLTHLPLFRDVTFDGAFAVGLGRDGFKANPDGLPPRAFRIEGADFDGQIRFGKFLNRHWQIGSVLNYYTFDYVDVEWGAGAFVGWTNGCTRVNLELAGGDEGLRGYAVIGWSWGAHPDSIPQDCRHIPVDTLSWLTRPTLRDISIRMRESETGPPPAQPLTSPTNVTTAPFIP